MLGSKNVWVGIFAEIIMSGSIVEIIKTDLTDYHKSVAVKEYVNDCGGDVVLRHLPPYTPELNLVKIQWRMIRKATGNRLYQSTEEIKESIRTMLDNGEAGVVKMFQYLT